MKIHRAHQVMGWLLIVGGLYYVLTNIFQLILWHLVYAEEGFWMLPIYIIIIGLALLVQGLSFCLSQPGKKIAWAFSITSFVISVFIAFYAFMIFYGMFTNDIEEGGWDLLGFGLMFAFFVVPVLLFLLLISTLLSLRALFDGREYVRYRLAAFRDYLQNESVAGKLMFILILVAILFAAMWRSGMLSYVFSDHDEYGYEEEYDDEEKYIEDSDEYDDSGERQSEYVSLTESSPKSSDLLLYHYPPDWKAEFVPQTSLSGIAAGGYHLLKKDFGDYALSMTIRRVKDKNTYPCEEKHAFKSQIIYIWHRQDGQFWFHYLESPKDNGVFRAVLNSSRVPECQEIFVVPDGYGVIGRMAIELTIVPKNYSDEENDEEVDIDFANRHEDEYVPEVEAILNSLFGSSSFNQITGNNKYLFWRWLFVDRNGYQKYQPAEKLVASTQPDSSEIKILLEGIQEVYESPDEKNLLVLLKNEAYIVNMSTLAVRSILKVPDRQILADTEETNFAGPDESGWISENSVKIYIYDLAEVLRSVSREDDSLRPVDVKVIKIQ